MPSQEFASHTGLYIVQVNLKVDVYNYNANAHKIHNGLSIETHSPVTVYCQGTVSLACVFFITFLQ